MRLPRGLGGRFDYGKSEELILAAVENGVNYFDTAYLYSGSEELLGEILRRNDLRDKVYIATKLPFQKCGSYDAFDRFLGVQLERLKTDHIDYYLIHNISSLKQWLALVEMGIEGWIAEKKGSGRIRQIGFSFHGPPGGFLELIDAYDWDFCQIQYNYMNETYQAGRAGLRAAAQRGLPVIIMEPLLGGKLANGVPPKGVRIFGDANAGYSPAAWSLRWLWNQPEVTVVLSGMNADSQLRDNLNTVDGAVVGCLSDEEDAAIDAVRAVFKEAYKIPCTGCNYCMPCPQNVDIPSCFAAYNASFANGFITGMTQYLTSTGANSSVEDSSVRRCVKCGRCEAHCPQHIAISRELVLVRRRMEPFWFGLVRAVMTRMQRAEK
jgi:predicted aldo/keto reductase-like oxidoreductase